MLFEYGFYCDLICLKQQIQGQETIDCSSLGPAGYPITGDFGILDSMRFDSDARYILVVEKVSSSSTINFLSRVIVLLVVTLSQS